MKCHNVTPWVAILNKQKCPFSKMENRKVNRSCLGLVPERGRRIEGKGERGEYGGNTMYSYMKMEK
jgi:hypothetical protein